MVDSACAELETYLLSIEKVVNSISIGDVVPAKCDLLLGMIKSMNILS